MVNHGTFLFSLEQEILAWRSRLELLEKEINTASSEKQQGLQEQVDELKSKYTSLQAKVEEVKRSCKDALPDVESEIKQSWNDLQKGLADTFKRLG